VFGVEDRKSAGPELGGFLNHPVDTIEAAQALDHFAGEARFGG